MKLFVRSRSAVQLRVVGVTVDRRTPELLGAARALEQARADKLLLDRYNEGVRRREAQRYFASLVPELPGMLRRQAD
jgi:Zn-dependent M32 family carboxypeptidase